MKPIVEDCYIDGDSLLDMAVGITPDKSYLFTFKGESNEPPITLTLSPIAMRWLSERMKEALEGETLYAQTGRRAKKRKRR